MRTEDAYRTIEKRSEGLFRDRGSKFLAFAFPVSSTKEIKSIQERLRKEYHDARHHCYAYRLGAAKNEVRANDDGEPSNSAGKPILGQIQAYDLSNVLVIVIRYFGGTLLGVGGLINAYRSAAAEALKKATIIDAVETDLIEISYTYPLTNAIKKIIDDEKMTVKEQNFTDTCMMVSEVRKSRTIHVLELVNKLTGAKAELKDPIPDSSPSPG
ncbi:MAG TPA: YigZ family protein [Bacteroides sp.]|nr:YigZ family protein [Bacteroides sp.]